MIPGNLILVRGVPGAGKTSLATTLCDVIDVYVDNHVISADDYFYQGEEYKFDPSKLKEAHSSCLERTRRFLERARDFPSKMGKPAVLFVANTFTREWEMDQYFELAREFDWRVHTIVVENRHESHNVHGVPDEKVKEMKSRFEIKL